MLNINEKSDYIGETERIDNIYEETQNKFEFDNPNYKVNFFGLGRDSEDLQ
ncbi:hypothetical protein [Clostridium sp.]|uniref:hypothetical protein n=1 Tax=Clostridium sp. TaxID=1506 RepID=UPI001A4BDD8F|nr:hypothetical protein [Clostridium sp.]MBK5241773.1 hypothetical protein [Clostridium sp.]